MDSLREVLHTLYEIHQGDGGRRRVEALAHAVAALVGLTAPAVPVHLDSTIGAMDFHLHVDDGQPRQLTQKEEDAESLIWTVVPEWRDAMDLRADAIVREVGSLVDFVWARHATAEASVVAYLQQCFEVELSYVNQINESFDDVDYLARALDRFSVGELVHFTSDPPDLEHIYRLMVRVVGREPAELARMVLRIYKQSRGALFVEVDTEGIRDRIHDFWHAVLPAGWALQLYDILDAPLMFLAASHSVDRDALVGSVYGLVPVLNESIGGFDRNFPAIFARYLDLVDDATPEDHEYISKISADISVLAEFEDSLQGDVEAAVRAFRNHHNQMPEGTLLMRAAHATFYYDFTLKKRRLRHWYYATLRISQLHLHRHDFERRVTVEKQRVMWNRWVQRAGETARLYTAATDYNRKVTVARVLHSHWVLKFLAQLHQSSKADLHFLKRSFHHWLTRWRRAALMAITAEKHNRAQAETEGLGRMIRRYNQIVEHRHQADELWQTALSRSNQVLLGSLWRQWCNRVHPPLAELYARERQFVHRRFFSVWTANAARCRAEEQLRAIGDRLVLQTILRHWLARRGARATLLSTLEQRSRQFARKVFVNWHESAAERQRARHFDNKRLCKQALHSWRLALRTKKYKPQVAPYLHRWVLQAKTNKYSKGQKDLIQKQHLNQWVARMVTMAEHHQLAHLFEQKTLQQRAYSKWSTRLVTIDQHKRAARQFALRRTFTTMRQKFHRYENIRHVKNIPDEIAVRACFQLWQEALARRFERRAARRVVHLKHDFAGARTRVFWTHWRRQLVAVNERSVALENRLGELTHRTATTADAFHRWVEKAKASSARLSEAHAFDTQRLTKYFLMVWYRRFSAVEALHEEAEGRVIDRDIDLIRSSMGRWAMRQMRVRRNNQSAHDFMRRWDTQRMRLLLELWAHKATERRGDITDVSSEPSPLANKSMDSANYMRTPVKDQVPSTPRKTSPTKLLPQTQRLKQERVLSVRRHFQRAKSHSTPRRRQPLTETLERIRLTSPVPSPTTETPSRIPRRPINRVYAREDDPVASAKRLQRIRPLFVPPDLAMEPRFSPVGRLREKQRGSLDVNTGDISRIFD